MIETKSIEGAYGVKLSLQNANLLIVVAKKGYVMCGYLNIETAEKLGDAACIVTGVSTFEEVLDAKVKEYTTKAAELGVTTGMTGRQAIEKLN
jgi:uncharacterized protein YunC (DUF1805 family)